MRYVPGSKERRRGSRVAVDYESAPHMYLSLFSEGCTCVALVPHRVLCRCLLDGAGAVGHLTPLASTLNLPTLSFHPHSTDWPVHPEPGRRCGRGGAGPHAGGPGGQHHQHRSGRIIRAPRAHALRRLAGSRPGRRDPVPLPHPAADRRGELGSRGEMQGARHDCSPAQP